ncbi:PEMT/PEM2 methyltransferase family protein [Dictyocoela muelleri]|nr:PEMT/PEM2 methyltransferase family protein [Dictyocoela muelleri]
MLTSTKFFILGSIFSYGVYCSTIKSLGHVLAILSLFTYLITYLSNDCAIVKIDIIETNEIVFLIISGILEYILFSRIEKFFKIPIKIGGLLLIIGFLTSIISSYYLRCCYKYDNKTENTNKNEINIVDSGIYAYVRHPVYLGLFLMVIGSLMHVCAIFSIILVFLCLPNVNKKIQIEEQNLIKKNSFYKNLIQKTYYGMPRL